jgi:hypothetical protein
MNYSVLGSVGVSGGWLLLRAPSMQRMFGLGLAMHVHGVILHVQLSSHSEIVMSCGLVLCSLVIINLYNLVCLDDWRKLMAIW